MPAFTQLCSKYNISLAHDALTLYPKKTGKKEIVKFFNKCTKEFQYHEIDGEYSLNNDILKGFDALGRPRFVQRKDADHWLFHDDNFDKENTHYHMKFPFAINYKKLDDVLTVFVKYDVISEQEKFNFLRAYKLATPLDNFASKHAPGSQKAFPRKENFSKVQEGSHRKFADPVEKFPKNPQPQASGNGNEPPISPPPPPFAGKHCKLKPKPVYTEADNNFLLALHALKEKRDYFAREAKKNPERYVAAAEATEQLCLELETESDLYFSNRNEQTYLLFKRNCETAIKSQKFISILGEHRGGKKILGNIGAAIIGLGVFYLAAVAINYYKTDGKHFFFHFNTDTINKTKTLNTELASVAPAA